LRALTDGALDTKVLDLVIAPEYQRQGIGLRIMEKLLRHPGVRGTTIYFETARKNFAFAARCGYARRTGLSIFARKAGGS
jgi:ribosomal protein S18 acetylase RimI-like enzyme